MYCTPRTRCGNGQGHFWPHWEDGTCSTQRLLDNLLEFCPIFVCNFMQKHLQLYSTQCGSPHQTLDHMTFLLGFDNGAVKTFTFSVWFVCRWWLITTNEDKSTDVNMTNGIFIWFVTGCAGRCWLIYKSIIWIYILIITALIFFSYFLSVQILIGGEGQEIRQSVDTLVHTAALNVTTYLPIKHLAPAVSLF